MLLQVLNGNCECNTYIKQAMGHITFGDHTVTTIQQWVYVQCNCMYILLPEHLESPLGTVQAKKSVRNAPASFAFTQVLHRSNNTLKSSSTYTW